MLRRIILFSLTHRFLVFALALGAAAAGVIALNRMPADVLPPLNAPVVLVVVANEGLAPQEMEALAARPLEAAVRALPGVQFVRTKSSQGLTILWVQFAWGSDFYRILQQVAGAVAQVQGQFPPGTQPPVLSSATSRLQQVVEFYLAGDLPPRDLRELADYDVRFALLGIPGVMRVLDMGGEVRQYHVAVHLNALAAYRVGLDDIASAIRRSNVSFAGGFLVTGPQEVTVRGLGRLRTLDDLANVRVTSVGGRPLLLKDVATVEEGSAIRRSAASLGGRVVVTGTVSKQYGSDTRPIATAVESTFATLRTQLPHTVTLRTFYSQAQLIDNSLAGLRDALLIGGAAVVLVIWLLVGDWVLTLVIAAIMPLSLLATFAAMGLAGIGLDTMSLGGIAVGLGIMIDAAIVDTENIYRHLRERPDDKVNAALEGSLEVRRPVLFSTLIIAGMFVPVFFLGGIAGRIFTPFAFAVLSTVIIGYVLSLTVTPALAATFLRPERKSARAGFLIPTLRQRYEAAIDDVIRHPARVGVVTLAVVIVTAVIASAVGFDFLPELDEGAMMVKVQSPPGTSLDLTDLQARRAAEIIARGPDVREVIVRAGQPEGSEEPEGVNNTEIWVRLAPFGHRKDNIETIRRWMRDSLAAITGARVIVTAPLIERIQESLGQSTAPLVVSIVGDNLDTLSSLSDRLARTMSEIAGIVDVNPEAAEAVTQIAVRPDRLRAARYGLDPEDIAGAVELAYEGRVVTTVLRGQRKEYGVFMRLQKQDRAGIEDLGRLPIATRAGGNVRLDQVADVSLSRGPSAIRRDNGERRIQVDGNLAGIDLSSAVAALRARIPDLQLPPGYQIRFAGSYEEQRRVEQAISIAIVAAIFVIFVILEAAFGSAKQAALMILTIPLALSGGVVALWITRSTFNVSSLIGILALFGLAIQKAVLLLQHANDDMARGLRPDEAAKAAAIIRFRPVFLTTAAAALAVLPLAIGLGAGAQLQQPMAIVIVGGVTSDMLLALGVLPALYKYTVRRRQERTV